MCIIHKTYSYCSNRVGKSMLINAVIGVDLLPYAKGNTIFRIYGTNDGKIKIRSTNEEQVVRLVLYKLNTLENLKPTGFLVTILYSYADHIQILLSITHFFKYFLSFLSLKQ